MEDVKKVANGLMESRERDRKRERGAGIAVELGADLRGRRRWE